MHPPGVLAQNWSLSWPKLALWKPGLTSDDKRDKNFCLRTDTNNFVLDFLDVSYDAIFIPFIKIVRAHCKIITYGELLAIGLQWLIRSSPVAPG